MRVRLTLSALLLVLVAASCTVPPRAPATTAPAARATPTAAPAPAAPAPTAAAAPATSPAAGPSAAATALLSTPLVDVRTGERFTLGGFPGKVTMVQAMAVW